MSPEQVRGTGVDHRSDIFSFGAIFCEMLSGTRAFRRDTAAETMTAILKEEPLELTEMNRNIAGGNESVATAWRRIPIGDFSRRAIWLSIWMRCLSIPAHR